MTCNFSDTCNKKVQDKENATFLLYSFIFKSIHVYCEKQNSPLRK